MDSSDPVPLNEPGGFFSALQYRQFRFLLVSDLTYFLAMIGQVALRIIVAWELTHSAVALSSISLAMGLPMLLLAPLGGVVADRFERRRLIVLGQLLILVNGLLVLGLMLSGDLRFWHLMVTTVITGCAFPVISPARQALVAHIVPRAALKNAFALSASSLNLARVAGPALVGLLIPWWGTAVTWGASVLIYALGLLMLLGVSPCPVDKQGHSAFAGFLSGLRYLRENPTLRIVFVFGFIPALFGLPFQSLLIMFADEVWLVGTRGFGFLQAAAGLGAVLGSVYVARSGADTSSSRTQLLSLMLFGLLVMGFAWSPTFWVALILILLAMTCANIFVTTNTVAVQLLCSDEMRGRMSSIILMTIALTPLGTVPMARLAEALGAPTAVMLCGAATTLLGLLLFALSPRLRRLDTSLV